MRHIDHEIGTDALGDLRHALPVEAQGIGAGAADQELGLGLDGDAFHFVVIDLFVLVETVGNDVEQLAGQVGRRTVGQVTAVTEVHAHDGIARLQDREIDGLIGLRTGMRLHVGVFGTEQALDAVDGDLLDLIDKFTAAIETLARITFGIFVGQLRALSFHHCRAGVIFRRDQFDMVILTMTLVFDVLPQFRIDNAQGFCSAKHR